MIEIYGGRGHWSVNIFLFVYFMTCGDFDLILIGLFIKLSVQAFQQLIVVNIEDNFVYHHWGCK